MLIIVLLGRVIVECLCEAVDRLFEDGVVLIFYSSRVDFTNENLYPTGVEFGLSLLGGVAPTVSFAGLRVAVPLVWRRVLSIRHTGSCGYSGIDVAVLAGSR
jgi:hypothetical protein